KIPSIALSSKIEDGQGENIHEQELSHTEHITQSLHNNFTIEEIDNPHLTLPSDINAGQIEKYFQIDNTLLALVLRGSMNVQITVPIDFTVTFAGVLVAQQGDSQWTKLIEIENTEVTTRNNPYYLVVDNQKLLLTIVDQNGAGSSEGIMKVFALSETSHWKLESCYYYGGSSDSFPDDDQFSFSARFSSFTPEPIGSCDNVELVFLTQ
ncbi:MAG: hypothetical protein Q8Q49_06645, partial [bacterium]|nr:hypothetical protein [bacterium]